MTRLVCGACQQEYAETDARMRCECGGLLEVRHATPAMTGQRLRQLFDGRHGGSGVWRFREIILPGAGDAIVTYPEGNTPLLERAPISAWAGGPVLLKHEGHNPTASFKDRGMTVGVTQARRLGVRAVACASTGNTGASMGAYAALAGLPALALVPLGHVAQGKLTQLLAYGVRTLFVRGDFDACQTLAHEAAERLGIYLLNSVNPFRLEGQKAIVLELLQQMEWNTPDWIVVPAGNLGNTAAFGKALREACEWGLIARVPRLAAIQAAGAAPFALSFRDGFQRRHRVTAETVASAIRVGDPASYDRAVRAIRETNGVVTTVTDQEILDAKAVIDTAGVGCEPASAASVAGTRRLRAEGVIAGDARVVAVLTGHLLKDPAIAGPNQPLEIDPRLSEIETVLRSSTPGRSLRSP